MTIRQICPFILLVFVLFLQNCAGDRQQAPQRSSPATTEQPATNEPPAKQESPDGTSLKALRENKKNRIGTVPTGKDAELNTTIPAPPTKVEGKRVERAGPPGYIAKKDAILQAEPSQNAAKIATLKQYETVYILETKMTDEAGRPYDIPQWYKIQCSDGQKGWIKSQFVGLPF